MCNQCYVILINVFPVNIRSFDMYMESVLKKATIKGLVELPVCLHSLSYSSSGQTSNSDRRYNTQTVLNRG